MGGRTSTGGGGWGGLGWLGNIRQRKRERERSGKWWRERRGIERGKGQKIEKERSKLK